MSTLRPYPAEWDGKRWLVYSESVLPASMLRATATYLLRVQSQRRLGLSPGPLRDELDETVKALREGRIVSATRGGDVFKATAGTGKIISLGAA